MDGRSNLAYRESAMSMLLRKTSGGLHRLLADAGCSTVNIHLIHDDPKLLPAMSSESGIKLKTLAQEIYQPTLERRGQGSEATVARDVGEDSEASRPPV